MPKTQEQTIIGRHPNRTEIEGMLRRHSNKYTYENIQEEIKKKWNVGMSTRTLRYYANNYLDGPRVAAVALDQRDKIIDLYTELSTLYEKQKERIQIDGNIETSMKKLLKNQHKEIETAVELLREIKTLSFEMGLMEKRPERIEHSGSLVAENFSQGLALAREAHRVEEERREKKVDS